MTTRSLAALLALLSSSPLIAQRDRLVDPTVELQPNIVVILADDVGVDLLSTYDEGPSPACTPNVDRLAAEGMLFRNAWSNPLCSPTRATLLTGRHAFRHGIGELIGRRRGLRLNEFILPEMLSRYDTACCGKWHLAGNLGDLHPNDSGFGTYAGGLGGGVGDYFNWSKTVDGQTSDTQTYATTDTIDEAIGNVLALQEPWFILTSFNAVHAPFHEPPASVCPPVGCPNGYCANLGQNPTTPELVKAVAEGMDTELGRLLEVLDLVDPEAWVFFIGDNGTPRQAIEDPFDPAHGKGSLYQGGVNVPFIVRGPRVLAGEESEALVGVVDVFATLAEITHVDASTEDSVSMVPLFMQPQLRLRQYLYTERFSPVHGDLPFDEHIRAVRDRRYKLIRETGQPDEFYDLQADPLETVDLYPNFNNREQRRYDGLVAELVRLGVD